MLSFDAYDFSLPGWSERHIRQEFFIESVVLSQFGVQPRYVSPFFGELGPKRLILGSQVCRQQSGIVHPEPQDVIAARQGYGLAHGHEWTESLLPRLRHIAIDVYRPILHHRDSDLIRLYRHRVFASVWRPQPKDPGSQLGLNTGLGFRWSQAGHAMRAEQWK